MSSSLQYLLDNKLTTKDLDIKVEYLMKKFLVKNTLICIYARAAQGKSWLMLSLCIYLIEQQKIKDCIYLDMDNGVTVLKDRGIDKVVEKYSNFHYIHKSKFNESPRSLLQNLAKEAKTNPENFEDRLFIFDSIRDFTLGKDMTTDKDINPLIEELQCIRNAKATVVFLHHTTKDITAKEYKGSTAFRDGIDISYFLTSKRNKNILNFVLTADKDRLDLEDCAFELDTKTFKLETEDSQLANIKNKTEKLFIEETIKILKEVKSEGINQVGVIKKLDGVFSQATVRKYLEKYEDVFWLVKKVTKEKNATYYYLIDTDFEVKS